MSTQTLDMKVQLQLQGSEYAMVVTVPELAVRCVSRSTSARELVTRVAYDLCVAVGRRGYHATLDEILAGIERSLLTGQIKFEGLELPKLPS